MSDYKPTKNINSEIEIFAKLNPFKTETVHARTEAGQTLTEVLGVVRKEARVEVDGVPVARADFDTTIVEAGQTINVAVIPQGGDDGRKVLNTVLKIAVVATAVAISVATFGAGTPLAAAMTATLTVGGNLLVDAIVPPPTIGSDPRGGGVTFNRLASLTGSRNRLQPYAPVPRVYGKYRIYPPMSAKPYTEIGSNVQYLRLLFNCGYGPLKLSNPRIGDTIIGSFDSDNKFTANANFKSVNIDVAESPRYFSRNVGEASVTATLNDNGDVVTRTTELDTDEISLDLIFPQGLYKVDEDGEVVSASVEFLIEYRASGTSDPWINPLDENDPNLGDPNHNFEDEIPREYGDKYPFNPTQPDQEYRYRVTGDEPETLRNGLKFRPETAGQYDVRITRRTSSTAGNGTVFKDCTWSVLRSIKYERPTDLEGTVQIGMRIRATDQLQGVLDNFSVEAESYLPTYDGSSWSEPVFDPQTGGNSGGGALSNNPAWILADILTGSANPNPVPFSKINADALKSWADFCTAEGFGYDSPSDARTTILQVLSDVASTGRASFAVQDGVYSVIVDQAKATPVQAFTPRNSANFKATKKFKETPHALRVQFINPDAGWQKDERIVYDDGYDESTATNIETMEVSGVTSSDHAWKMGRYYLAVMRLRPEVYKITTDVENIVCQRGDRVTFAHDVPLIGTSTGRVKSVTKNGSNEVTTITFDEAIQMESGKTYQVRIRAKDNSQAVYSVDTAVGEFNTVTLTTPTADDIQAGDLFLFGETNKESIDLIVQRIDAGQDLEAELTLVDYNEAIYSADTGTIPAYDSKITEPVDITELKPPAPVIESTRSDETTLTKDVDGTISAKMISSFDLTGGFPSAKIEARWRRENVGDGWIGYKTVDASSGNISMDGVEIGKSYIYQLRTIAGDQVSDWVESSPHTIIGKSGNPSDVSDFTVTLDQIHLRMNWTDIGDTDLSKYEIRKGVDWASGTLMGFVDASETTISVTTTGEQTYWIKAIDTAGNKSFNASSFTIDVPTDFLDDVLRSGGSSLVSNMEINSGDPYLDFIETDLADKNWRLRTVGGNFHFEERNDAFSLVGTPVKFESGAPNDSLVVTSSGKVTFAGDVLVSGNFEVQGVVNFVNEDNLQVQDKTITINKNGTDGSAEGAGLIVERPAGNHSMLWNSTNGFEFSDKIRANAFEVGTTGRGITSGGFGDFNSMYLRNSQDQIRFTGGDKDFWWMSKTVGTESKSFAVYVPGEGFKFVIDEDGSIVTAGSASFSADISITRQSASHMLKFERTGTATGSVYLGSANGDLRVGTSAGAFDIIQATTSLVKIAGSTNWGTNEYLRANPSQTRFEVHDSVGDKIAMGYLDGLAKNDGSGNWDSNHYGFWVKAGDKLTIDGDMEYMDGDWLVEGDATIKIQDGINGYNIINLGTHNGEKGLFYFDGTVDENIVAQFGFNSALVAGWEINKDKFFNNTNKIQIGKGLTRTNDWITIGEWGSERGVDVRGSSGNHVSMRLDSGSRAHMYAYKDASNEIVMGEDFRDVASKGVGNFTFRLRVNGKDVIHTYGSTVKFAGWTATDARFSSPDNAIQLRAENNSILVTTPTGSGTDVKQLFFGKFHDDSEGGWINEHGFYVDDFNGDPIFELSSRKALIGKSVNIFGGLYIGSDKKVNRVYARGTGNNNSTSRLLKINGSDIYSETGRGLRLTVYNSSMNQRHSELFDVYGDSARMNELGSILLGNTNLSDGSPIDPSDLIVLTSYDAIRDIGNGDLTKGMDNCGGDWTHLVPRINSGEHRMPYVLIGQLGIGRGNGVEVYTGDGASNPYAIAEAIYVDGTVRGSNVGIGTKIVGDRISTGVIQSTNWTGDAGVKGSKFDLDNGILKMRFGSADIFAFDAEAGTAKIAGANFDSVKMYSANNGGSFKGVGMYMNWSTNQFSLGDNISFNDGEASLNNITANSVTFTGSEATSTYDESGFVVRDVADDIQIAKEHHKTANLASNASSTIFDGFTADTAVIVTGYIVAQKGDKALYTARFIISIEVDIYGDIESHNISVYEKTYMNGWGTPSSSNEVTINEYFGSIRVTNSTSAEIEVSLFARSLNTKPIQPPPAPSTPTGLFLCQQTDIGIKVSWNSVSGADQYRVQYATSGGGPWTDLGTTTGTSIGHSAPYFDQDQLYYYRVRAENSGGNSSYTTPESGTYNGLLPCPT